MATGYTADVAEGTVTDFRTFALRCARAFGATIMQRDNPSDEPPKHRTVSEFYTNAVPEAEAELASLRSLTLAEAQAAMGAERESITRQRAEYIAEKTAKRARYEAMLSEVEAWAAPTRDHLGLKSFMLEQLQESIRFDCGDSLWPPLPEEETVGEWLQDKIELAEDTLQRLRKELAAEEERCRAANAWIDALYESLNAARVQS